VSALLLLAGIGAFGALLYLVVLPNVVQEIRVLTSGGPGSLDALARSIRDAPFVPAIDRLLERLEDRLQDLLGSLPQIVISAAVAITAAVSAVFLALYFAVDPDTYVRGILRLAPWRGARGCGSS
jgi:predicted PurR-regulated permease PerM